MLMGIAAIAMVWIVAGNAYWFARGLALRLPELRDRADELVRCFERGRSPQPRRREAYEPGVVFSRHLDHLLRRPIVDRSCARHRARRTLRYLRWWFGCPYNELKCLASDIMAWSRFGRG
jgi:hypothetical protein